MAGLRVGLRLAIFAWPALWAVPELTAFVLLPLLALARRGALREVFWSDGRGLLAGDATPPVPAAGVRLKLWSAAMQAMAIVLAVWLGIVSFHASVRPPAGPALDAGMPVRWTGVIPPSSAQVQVADERPEHACRERNRPAWVGRSPRGRAPDSTPTCRATNS